MPAKMNELSVFVLLLLSSLGESKPLERVKRTIVKDYFNPLLYPTDKLQFEKGEDGKYHEQNHADPTHSRVEYAVAHAIDASNEIFDETSKSSEQTLKAEDAVVANGENHQSLSTVSKSELQKEGMDLSTKISTPGEAETEVKGKDLIPETTATLDDSGVKWEDASSKERESSAKLDIPIDSKWSLVPKPDGKDDRPYEGGEEYLPEPPIVPEGKEDEGKVEIGQIPKHHPFFVPPNVPLLIPKSILFRVLSLLPKPPAFEVSDRLPLPEPEVIEESSETAVVENIDPSGPMLIKEGRRFVANHFVNPLRIGLKLPFFSPADVLKEVVDEEKSEIVEIGGHPMLLQRKVVMSPHHDRMHLSVMSIQPLEDANPHILKELEEIGGKKEAEKRSLEEEGERGAEVLSPLPRTVKGKEPEVTEETDLDAKIPPPVVELSEEDSKTKKEAKIRDGDEEKPADAEDVKKDRKFLLIFPKEKTTLMNGEKDVPGDEKEGEKITAVVKEEKDVLIGTEDLLQFRNEMNTQNPTSAETGVDVMRDGFGEESETEEESKYHLGGVTAEGKKGDEGILEAEEVVASLGKTEFTEGEDSKGHVEIPKMEPKVPEKVAMEGDEEKSSAEEAHSATELVTSKDAKEKSAVSKAESKEKGDDGTLSSKEAVEPHVATEIIASEEAKGKTDVRNLQHSEESSPKIEDFGLKKTEGAILEERKKKFDERSPSKKKKCKCEDSDESDSDDEDGLE